VIVPLLNRNDRQPGPPPEVNPTTSPASLIPLPIPSRGVFTTSGTEPGVDLYGRQKPSSRVIHCAVPVV
jgi:hypothetical protein